MEPFSSPSAVRGPTQKGKQPDGGMASWPHGAGLCSSTEKPREACFDPGNIMNGTRIGVDFKLGSTVTYQCDSGYKIVDPSSITCVIGADGKPAWSRALPSCNGTGSGPPWVRARLVSQRRHPSPLRLPRG